MDSLSSGLVRFFALEIALFFLFVWVLRKFERPRKPKFQKNFIKEINDEYTTKKRIDWAYRVLLYHHHDEKGEEKALRVLSELDDTPERWLEIAVIEKGHFSERAQTYALKRLSRFMGVKK